MASLQSSPTSFLTSPTMASTQCASSDAYCYDTSAGWAPAAASYLASLSTTSDVFASQVIQVGSDIGALATTLPMSELLALDSVLPTSDTGSNAHFGPADASVVLVFVSHIPTSDAQPFQSIYEQAESLQAQATGVNENQTAGNTTAVSGSQPAQNSSGLPQQTSSSHAAAAPGAKPTDAALMAMAGVLAGVAGLAYGL